MSRLQPCQGVSSALLHLIMQDGFQPACGVPLTDIRDGCLADIKGRDEVSIDPSLVYFEQYSCSG
jgi:hypothetical protein